MRLSTKGMEFSNGSSGPLLSVNAGIPASEAINLAADLSEGIQLLCERLYNYVNDGGETIHLCELRSLGFLAETAGILSRAAGAALEDRADPVAMQTGALKNPDSASALP